MNERPGNIDELLEEIRILKSENRELKERLEYYHRLLDSIPSPVFVKNPDLTYRDCNQAFQDFLGLSREQIAGKRAAQVINNEHLHRYQETDQHLLENGGTLFYETLLINAQGAPRSVMVHKAVFYDRQDAPAGIVGVLVDIHENKEDQKKLLLSEEKYRALFEKSRDGIVRTTIDGRILECNRAYTDMLGYSPEELQGVNYRQITHERWRRLEEEITQEQIIKRGYTDQYEKEYIRKDGSLAPVSVAAWMARDVEGEPCELWGIIRDITRQRETQNAIDKVMMELKRSNQELEQFAYIASHDLQEPLRKIISFGERLEAQAREKIDEKSIDYLGRMTSAAGRMQNLINSLLNYSRITTRGKDFKIVDLNGVMADVLEDMEVKISRKKAVIDVQPLPPARVDAIQMRQLFQNLIANAVKFSRAGEPPIVTVRWRETEISLGLPRKFYEFSVRDNGIGFEEEYAQKIFLPFKKLHGRDEFEGTGIGLSICDKIVKRHGGEIHAASKPGEGSTFIFTLPKPTEFENGCLPTDGETPPETVP